MIEAVKSELMSSVQTAMNQVPTTHTINVMSRTLEDWYERYSKQSNDMVAQVENLNSRLDTLRSDTEVEVREVKTDMGELKEKF